jgi:hypothetical protein
VHLFCVNNSDKYDLELLEVDGEWKFESVSNEFRSFMNFYNHDFDDWEWKFEIEVIDKFDRIKLKNVSKLTYNVTFNSNGTTKVSNSLGEEVPYLQISWVKFYLKFLIENGIDVRDCNIIMPNGFKATVFYVENADEIDVNWSIEESKNLN